MALELETVVQFGIAGVALYLVYDLANKVINNNNAALTTVTTALNDVRKTLEKLCDKIDAIGE